MKNSVEIEDKIEGLNVLLLTKCGLVQGKTYIRGVFIPTVNEILLQKVPKIIKIDSVEIYSLQYFIESYLKDNHINKFMVLNDPIYCSNPLLWGWLKEELIIVANRNPWEKFIKTYYKYIVEQEK